MEPRSAVDEPSGRQAQVLALVQAGEFSRAIEATLRRLSRPCLCVQTVDEAVAAVGRGGPRLVLLDLSPPGTGAEAPEAIDRLLATRSGLPIVAFVAPDDRDLTATVLRRGALLVMARPARTDDLESIMQLALHLGRLSEVRFPEPALQAMVELQQGLATGVSGEALLDLLLQILMRHLRADSGSLMLLEPDRQHLKLVAAVGLGSPEILGCRVRLGERVSGWVAEHNQPQVIVGRGQDDPRLAGGERARVPEVGLCLPMRGELGVKGVVSLNRDRQRELFLPAEVELGLVLAAELARVLERQEAAARQQELERTALQCDKLATLGEMAAGVAHEINNPLAFISSNLSCLRDYLRDVLPILHGLQGNEASRQRAVDHLLALDTDFILKDIPRCIEETQDGLDRVLRIVRDLRSLSREDRDVKELADPNQVVEGAVNVVWNQIKHKATLERELGPLPSIPCYPSLLGQAVLNLLSNAAYAVGKDGVVRVRTRADREAVVIEVEDNGCGMPPEVQRRLFQPFFTTKPRGVGTGLGLAVVKRALDKHGGRIEVESAVGRGTRFVVRLPLPEMGCGPG